MGYGIITINIIEKRAASSILYIRLYPGADCDISYLLQNHEMASEYVGALEEVLKTANRNKEAGSIDERPTERRKAKYINDEVCRLNDSI